MVFSIVISLLRFYPSDKFRMVIIFSIEFSTVFSIKFRSSRVFLSNSDIKNCVFRSNSDDRSLVSEKFQATLKYCFFYRFFNGSFYLFPTITCFSVKYRCHKLCFSAEFRWLVKFRWTVVLCLECSTVFSIQFLQSLAFLSNFNVKNFVFCRFRWLTFYQLILSIHRSFIFLSNSDVKKCVSKNVPIHIQFRYSIALFCRIPIPSVFFFCQILSVNLAEKTTK